MQLESLLNWSPVKRVETRNGPRNLRKAVPTEAFWAAWKQSKEALRSAGVSVSKSQSGWEVCWWCPLEQQEQAKIDAAQQASRATDADVNLPCPNGLSYLGYQKAGIAYAASRPNTLIADEMGLGKTIQAIGVMNADATIHRTLVVCPASLRLNWRREIEKWVTRPVTVQIVNGKSAVVLTGDVVIVNYDVLAAHRKVIDTIAWDLLVVDEAHYCKNAKTARTKAVLGSVSKGVRTAEGIKATRKLFLTGTPIVNRPVELWPLVEALDPTDMGRNFFSFAKRYCDAKQTRWGWDFNGASRLDELQRKLREKFMVRRLKADVLTELPAKRRQVIEIPANGAGGVVADERRIFDSYQAQIEALETRLREAEIEAAYYDADNTDEIEAIRCQISGIKSVAFTEMSKARHAVAVAKIPYVIEHIRDSLENGPVVCFAHHRDVIAAIAAEFGSDSVTLTGDTPMEARQAAVDTFQAGKVKLFIGNIQAAGVGITLTKSSHVIFAELDWVPGNLTQAEDRCHRIGQTDSVLVQHIVLENSVDSIMAKKLITKQEVISAALDTQTEANWGENATVEIDISTPKAIESEAAKLTPEQIAAIHTGLKMLAGRCDGARALDGAGFNKFDTRFGHDLAGRASLTIRQALLGQKLVRKYQRQLPVDLLERAGVEKKI